MECRVIALLIKEGDICGDGHEQVRNSTIIFNGTESLTKEALIKNLQEAQDSLTFYLDDFLSEYKSITDKDVAMALELQKKGYMQYGATGFDTYPDVYTNKFNLQIFSAFYFPALIANMCLMGTAKDINLDGGAGYSIDLGSMWLTRRYDDEIPLLNEVLYGGDSNLNYAGYKNWDYSISSHHRP